MEQIDYTIGDDVVCIKTHSKSVVKEGELYVVKGLKHFDCKCGIGVNVGIKDTKNEPYYNFCGECKTSFAPRLNDGIWWLMAGMFKKLDNLVNIYELTEILEQENFVKIYK